MKNKNFVRLTIARGCALVAALAMSSITGRAADATVGKPFAQSTITEVIKDVSIIPDKNNLTQSTPATVNEVFTAPQFLQTKRASRAQLTAADGTIVRVGSNTIFSFEPTSRTINLKQGSVLFNSPKGIGGGSIVTSSATATVTGTTIITSATPDGGFKIMVLEGTATVKLPNGTSVTLVAGQMIFVLPQSKGGGVSSKINFDLKQQAEQSQLVNGFVTTLPSQNLIVDATNLQQQQVKVGALIPTNQVVIGAVSPNQIVLSDWTGVNTADLATPTQNNDLVLGPTGNEIIPAQNTFLTPGVTYSAAQLGLPNGVISNDKYTVTGLIGGNVSASGNVNLSSLDGVAKLDIVSQGDFTFTNTSNATIARPNLVTPSTKPDYDISDTYFTGLSTTLSLKLASQNGFTIPAYAFIAADFEPPSIPPPQNTAIATPSLAVPDQVTNQIVDESPFTTTFSMTSITNDFAPGNNTYIENPTGNLQVRSIAGDVYLNGTALNAGFDTQGNVSVLADLGNVSVYDGNLTASSGNVYVNAGTDVSISAGDEQTKLSGNLVQIYAQGNVTVSSIDKSTTKLMSTGNLNIFAGANVTLNGTNVSMCGGSGTYIIGGNSVNLTNIDFTKGSTVYLYSATGELNTGTKLVDGDINMVCNVTVDGCNAANMKDVILGVTAANSDVQDALSNDITLGSCSLTKTASDQLFLNVLFTPALINENIGDNYYFVANGLLANNITLAGTGNLSGLSKYGSDLVAAGQFNISGDASLMISNTTPFRLFTQGGFNIASGTNISITTCGTSMTSIEFDSLPTIDLENMMLTANASNVTLQNLDGDIIINGSNLTSGNSSSCAGNLSLNVLGGGNSLMITNSTLCAVASSDAQLSLNADNISVTNSTLKGSEGVNINGGSIGVALTDAKVKAPDGTVNIYSNTDINVTNSTISAGKTKINVVSPNIQTVDAANTATVTFTAAHIVTITNGCIQTRHPYINAGMTLSMNGTTINGATQIDMSARTINLSNINFPVNSNIRLSSDNGMLAPNPNTNAASVVGDVNFITNVQYGGLPAQNYVPTGSGGSSTGPATNKITILPLNK